ncbi:hypothetical protein JW935_14845 [candidate division KSB1 bacterium]|nr:hypothetical protein [candidate division KSB1 bacterium]
MKKILALVIADLRNIYRDSMLTLVFLAPLIIIGFVRFAIPLLNSLLFSRWKVDLTPHMTFIKICFAFLPPMMFGMVIGYIFLDERDEDISTFIAITPLRKSGYLWFRILAPTIASFAFFFIYQLLTNTPGPGVFASVPIAIMIALETPIVLLFLVVYAGNKVEGLALSKAVGIVLFAPLAGYFMTSNWRFLAGVFPTFWVTESFLYTGNPVVNLLYTLIGILIHLFYLFLLLAKYLKN